MKILYILPHCSTGGMPQYVLKQTKEFAKYAQIYVLETNHYGDKYVVQRKELEKTTKFYAAFGQQNKIAELVDAIKPEIIHIQELPETFLNEDTLNFLYKKERPWFVIVTTHSSFTKGKDFRYMPDRIVAVNEWQKQKFINEIPGVDVDLWEYPIENLTPTIQQKLDGKKKLSFSDKYEKHILNVGLFTLGKSQHILFDLAKQYPNYCFHFVGNQAENFREYWEPLLLNKPENCVIWGERKNVEEFYTAADEMWFTSTFELNPLCVKEALSYGLPVTMRRLETYGTTYDKNKLITFSNFN